MSNITVETIEPAKENSLESVLSVEPNCSVKFKVLPVSRGGNKKDRDTEIAVSMNKPLWSPSKIYLIEKSFFHHDYGNLNDDWIEKHRICPENIQKEDSVWVLYSWNSKIHNIFTEAAESLGNKNVMLYFIPNIFFITVPNAYFVTDDIDDDDDMCFSSPHLVAKSPSETKHIVRIIDTSLISDKLNKEMKIKFHFSNEQTDDFIKNFAEEFATALYYACVLSFYYGGSFAPSKGYIVKIGKQT